jgi:hypothetical protein
MRAQVGRGEAVGAVWALTGGEHDTSALCVRDSEFVRMSRVRALFLGRLQPTILGLLLWHRALCMLRDPWCLCACACKCSWASGLP